MSTATDTGSARGSRRAAAGRRPSGAFTGTGVLIRLILRRDRIRIPVWLLGVVGFLTASAASITDVYPTAAERQSRGDFVQNPVLTIFSGPGYGADDYTVGAMAANEYLIYGVIAVALMSILLVVRHTRTEEETGRAELIRASVVGVHAAPSAALIVAVTANVLIGATTALALTASLEELTATGSWLFGMSMAAAGIAFAAVALVAVQVTEHARGATGLAVSALLMAFVLRAVGDIGERTLSWLSPIGWVQSTRAFVDGRWWPLLLPIALTLVLSIAAAVLAIRRDVGAGLVPPRPGPPEATRWLARPGGLALRLQRGSLVAWGAGLVMFGALFGSLVGEVEAFLDDNPQLQEFFGGMEDGALVEAFLSTVMLLLALLAISYALTAALRLRGEEDAGRAEPLLATPISRARWAAGHLGVALGGGALVVLGAAAGVGVTAAIEGGQASWVLEMLGAGLAMLPAVWFVVGVAVALYGLVPRAAGLAWVVLVHAAVVGLLGDALDLPGWMRALSPFHHVPDLPGGQVDVVPLVVLTVAAAGLVVLGLSGLRRRGIDVT